MKTVRITITLGEDDARKLAVWAWLKGRTSGVYAANIVSARIDADENRELQDKLLLEAAEARGLTKKEMIDLILSDLDKAETSKNKKEIEEYE
jgi:hypothetical protein